MKIIYFSLIVLVGSNLSSNKVGGLRAEKIHGGTVAKFGWFTYVVALMYKSETLSDENPCAGTIIDDWHIATAAHCFYDKRNGTYRNSYFYIIVSSTNLKKPEPSTRRIQVDILFIPSSYQSTGIDTYFTKGDLAIVKLKEEFGLYRNKNSIKKLNIPQRLPNKLYTSEFHVAGYGWHEIHFLPEEWNFNVENIRTGKSDGKMRYAKATVLNTTECQYIIGDKIAEGNMCAKLKRTHPEKPIGICQYDSGDPLTHISYLNGIVINGFMDCDDEKMPVVGLRTENIVGGTAVGFGWFKYVVALMYRVDGKFDRNPCAGAIIDNWHISTAAHCFYDNQLGIYRDAYYYIIVSLSNLRKQKRLTRRIKVDLVITPDYYESAVINTYYTRGDLAIVKLQEELGLHEKLNKVRRLNLPQASIRRSNRAYYVAGYGWSEIKILSVETNDYIYTIRKGKTDRKLRYAKAKVLNKTECQDIIGDKIAEGNICAKLIRTHPRKPVGICENDSGGPLSRGNYLNGIAINGSAECDEEKMPSIYISTIYYKDFIQNALRGNRTEDMRIVQLEEIRQGQFVFLQI